MLKKLNHTTFAEGEVTFHAHRASGGTLFEDTEVVDIDGAQRLFQCDAPIRVTHEEHAAQTIPPSPTGRYRIGGVVIADPYTERAKRVAD
jgi:hypothetical protein